MVCGSYWCVTDGLWLGNQTFHALLDSLVGQNIQNGQCQQWYNGVEYQGYTVDIELKGKKGLCIDIGRHVWSHRGQIEGVQYGNVHK